MTETKNSQTNFPRLYTIHSQKGGVGKTSIAVTIAGFSAIYHKKKTLIIDADLTGTSLIDIPEFTLAGDSFEESRFFNELILANPTDFQEYTPIAGIPGNQRNPSRKRLDSFYWSVPNYKNISYLPASPNLSDIQKTIPLISQEDHLLFFRLRIEDIIVTAMLDGFEVIVVDHPPGLYGISTASLNIVLDQKKGTKTNKNSRLNRLFGGSGIGFSIDTFPCHAILCTTPDPVDYRALIPSLSMLLDKKGKKTINSAMEIDIFLNKASERAGKGRFDAVFAMENILDDLRKFHDGRSVNEELRKVIRERTSGPGATAGEYIKDFSMDKIFPTISNMQETGKVSHAGMTGWCSQIGKAVNLFPYN